MGSPVCDARLLAAFAVPLFCVANRKLFAILFRWRRDIPVKDVTRYACVGYSRSGIAGNRKLSGNGIPRLVAASCTSLPNLAHTAKRGRP